MNSDHIADKPHALHSNRAYRKIDENHSPPPTTGEGFSASEFLIRAGKRRRHGTVVGRDSFSPSSGEPSSAQNLPALATKSVSKQEAKPNWIKFNKFTENIVTEVINTEEAFILKLNLWIEILDHPKFKKYIEEAREAISKTARITDFPNRMRESLLHGPCKDKEIDRSDSLFAAIVNSMLDNTESLSEEKKSEGIRKIKRYSRKKTFETFAGSAKADDEFRKNLAEEVTTSIETCKEALKALLKASDNFVKQMKQVDFESIFRKGSSDSEAVAYEEDPTAPLLAFPGIDATHQAFNLFSSLVLAEDSEYRKASCQLERVRKFAPPLGRIFFDTMERFNNKINKVAEKEKKTPDTQHYTKLQKKIKNAGQTGVTDLDSTLALRLTRWKMHMQAWHENMLKPKYANLRLPPRVLAQTAEAVLSADEFSKKINTEQDNFFDKHMIQTVDYRDQDPKGKTGSCTLL